MSLSPSPSSREAEEQEKEENKERERNHAGNFQGERLWGKNPPDANYRIVTLSGTRQLDDRYLADREIWVGGQVPGVVSFTHWGIHILAYSTFNYSTIIESILLHRTGHLQGGRSRMYKSGSQAPTFSSDTDTLISSPSSFLGGSLFLHQPLHRVALPELCATVQCQP